MMPPMVDVSVSGIVRAAPEDVFTFLADLENWPRWQSDMKSTTLASGEPGTVGAVYRYVSKAMGMTFDSTVRLTKVEAPREVAFEGEWTATLPRGSRRRSRRIESSARSACICSKIVAPGGGSTPATTTLPTSPPAWHPTTVSRGRAEPHLIDESGSAAGVTRQSCSDTSGSRDSAGPTGRSVLRGQPFSST